MSPYRTSPEPPPSFWMARRRVRQEVPMVVVGAGLVGLSTAYWLSKAGRRVVVLEGEHVASGASGRNAGFLITGSAEPYLRLARQVGQERALAFWRRTAENRELLRRELLDDGLLRCEFLQEGSWIAARNEADKVAELRKSAEALSAAGLLLEWVDGDALRRASGSARLGGAIYQKEDGGLDPVQLCQGLVRAGGFEVLAGARVRGLEEEKRGVRLLCEGGDLVAERVVLALNAYVPNLIPSLASEVLPVRAQMLATEPGARPLQGVWYLDDGFQYVRQLRDGRVLLGGCRNVAVEDEVGYALAHTQPVQEALEEFLSTVFPHLAGRAVQHRWAGTMAFTGDGFPKIGTVPGHPNALYAAGLTGHGLSLSFVLGRYLARRTLGEEVGEFLPS